MNKRSFALGASLVACLALTGAEAIAGAKLHLPVQLSTTSRYAVGSMGTARNGTDPYSYIGCAIATGNGSTNIACVARDANNVSVFCNALGTDSTKWLPVVG